MNVYTLAKGYIYKLIVITLTTLTAVNMITSDNSFIIQRTIPNDTNVIEGNILSHCKDSSNADLRRQFSPNLITLLLSTKMAYIVPV